jgi:CHAT domain-containing protein
MSSVPLILCRFDLRSVRRPASAAHIVGVTLLALIISCLPCQTIHTRAQTAPANAAALTSQSAESSVTNVLKTDAPTERELKGGASDSFRLKLTSGQFLHVIVEQKGIDVVVALFAPDGRQITTMDSPNANQGAEPIVAIAEQSGDYRIEVRSPNNKASAGRYEIAIIAQREATSKDQEHVSAERAFAEGQRLRSQRTAPSRQAAIKNFELALPYFQSVADLDRQALTLLAISFAFADSSEFREALDNLRQVLPLTRALGNQNLEGAALNLTGGAYDVLGDIYLALDYYRRALVLFRATRNRSAEASVLNNLGKIYNDIADWQKAVEYYSNALQLFRALGDRRRESIVLNNIGVVFDTTGESEKALDLFQQSLLLRRALGDKALEADALNSIGTAYRLLGETKKALDYYNQALPLRRVVGDRRLEATTLDSIGTVYAALGQPEQALEQHRQALQLQRAVENPRGQAVSLGNIAYVYSLLGQPQKAIENYNEALSLFRRIGDLNSQALMLQGISRVERDRGHLTEALTLVEEALRMFEEVRARAESQQLRSSYFASKQDAYKLAIEVLMKEHANDRSQGHDAEALQASERGRARSLLEMLNEAHVDIRQGVSSELIARERELNQLLNAKAQRQIQLKAQKGSEQEIATLEKEIGALEDDYLQTQATIRKNSPQYAALTQPQPLGLKEIQQQLDQDTVLLEYSLGDERSYVWVVTPNSLKSLELPKREQIEKSARQVYELLTSRSLFKSLETAEQRQQRIAQADSQMLEASRGLSQMIIAPVASELGNKRLVIVADGALQYVPFAALPLPSSRESGVGGLESKTVGNRTPDSRLQTRDSARPLIIDHEVVSLPSASALAVQRKSLFGRKLAPNAVAVIADPVFSATDERLKASVRIGDRKQTQTDDVSSTRIIEHLADDSGKLVIRRLQFTRQEAEQILAVAPKTGNLKAIDFKANRATAISGELSKYRYVHFATHGYLDSDRPDLSAVVLSLVDEQGKPQDGFLRAREIYNLNLPAELVVLSACQTGLGKEIKGEGLVGLTRGFMYAGARRVVVSLWNVNDKATAELMQRFYRRMLKDHQSPAASLRAAQIEMWQQKQWQSPYYWAAFVLQGEWK